MSDNKKQLLGNPASPSSDDPAQLLALFTVTKASLVMSEDRKTRISKLMSRKGYQKLSPQKRARMARRSMNAAREASSSADLCEQLQHRLQQD